MSKDTWDQFQAKAFWALLVGMIAYASVLLKDVSDKLSTVISTVTQHEVRLNYIEKDIRKGG